MKSKNKKKSDNTAKERWIEYQEKRGGKFKRGNPGKPRGSLSLTAMIKKKLKTMSPDERRSALEALAENIIQDALESNNKMRQLIWNYLDGMPRQGIDIGADEKIGKVKFEIVRNRKNDSKTTSD